MSMLEEDPYLLKIVSYTTVVMLAGCIILFIYFSLQCKYGVHVSFFNIAVSSDLTLLLALT